MSGYRPRHAATDTPPAGIPSTPPAGARALPAPPAGPSAGGAPQAQPSHGGELRRRGWGAGGLVAAGVAVLAVVAVLLILSLPKASHSTAPRASFSARAATGASRLQRPSPGSSGTSGRKRAPAKPATRAKRATSVPTSSSRPATKATSATSPLANPGVATSPAENLPVPGGFGPLLRQVWVSAAPGHAAISAADVLSTLPGSVYYAEQPAIAYYWAVSQFVPSAHAEALGSTPAGKAVLAQFGYVAVFYKAAGHNWAYAGAYRPGKCSAIVPAPVYKVWGFCLSSQVGS